MLAPCRLSYLLVQLVNHFEASWTLERGISAQAKVLLLLQELNDKRLTLMEGSALSERDLVRAKAETATACLLLADRFSPKPMEEDLNLQFQVQAESNSS